MKNIRTLTILLALFTLLFPPAGSTGPDARKKAAVHTAEEGVTAVDDILYDDNEDGEGAGAAGSPGTIHDSAPGQEDFDQEPAASER